jgi:hypothetical protein
LNNVTCGLKHLHTRPGRIALNEGTEESARRAVIHLENQLKVNESIGDVEGIAMAQANIAIAKSKFEDGDSEELLKVSRDVYEFMSLSLVKGMNTQLMWARAMLLTFK